MTRKCSKKAIALTWALLECMFFSSVVLGWTWMSIVFRSDGYFPEYCNRTLENDSLLNVAATQLPTTAATVVTKAGVRCRVSRAPFNQTTPRRCNLKRAPREDVPAASTNSYQIDFLRVADAHTLE
ncbi:solute carrier family 43 member 3, partial [Biomphalaria glabrata]